MTTSTVGVKRPRRRVTEWIAGLVDWIGMIAIVAMVIHILAEVIGRSFFNHPIPGTLDYVTYYYMVIVSFVGMYMGQRRREHVSVTMVIDRLGIRARLILTVLGNLLTAVLLGLFVWLGAENALHQMALGEYSGAGVSGVIIWPARFIVPITLGMFLITLVAQTIEYIRKPTTLLTDEEEFMKQVELI